MRWFWPKVSLDHFGSVWFSTASSSTVATPEITAKGQGKITSGSVQQLVWGEHAMPPSKQPALTLPFDGQNRAVVITESLARAVAAIRSTSRD